MYSATSIFRTWAKSHSYTPKLLQLVQRHLDRSMRALILHVSRQISSLTYIRLHKNDYDLSFEPI